DASVTDDDVAWARAEVARNAYRTRPESPDWFGHALAERLRLDIGIPGAPRNADEKGNRRRVNAILRAWLARGVLQRERRRDAGNRKAFEYCQPGSGDGSEDAS